MVTKPPPQPQWGYSAPGYSGQDAPLADEQIKHLAEILGSSTAGLGEDSPKGLRKLLTTLFCNIEAFTYSDERGKGGAGYSLPPIERLAALRDMKKWAGELCNKLTKIDDSTGAELAFAYGAAFQKYRDDVMAVHRLYENIVTAERRILKGDDVLLPKPAKKKGTPLTRIGRFVALRLVDIFEHSPDETSGAAGRRREFTNSTKQGKDDGPRFVHAGLKMLLPEFTDTQARTALRYALEDREKAAKVNFGT